MSSEKKFNSKETGRYIFWCIMTTAVSWITCALFTKLFQAIIPDSINTVSFIANLLSWICAVTFSFVANKIRVFGSTGWGLKVVLPEIIKFFSTRFAVGQLEILLVPILVSAGLSQPLFGVDGMLAKVIVTPVVIAFNYCLGKYFVFRRKKATDRKQLKIE